MSRGQERIADICDRLADAYCASIPLSGALQKGKRRLTNEEIISASETGLEKFYEAARAEREKHKLGVLGKARVAYGLQQRLTSAGYPTLVVRQVLFSMLLSSFFGGR